MYMYHASQHGGLEYLARSNVKYSSDGVFYASTSAISSGYNDGMFIPSRDFSFNYKAADSSLQPYSKNQASYLFHTPQPEYHFIPDAFLKPGKEGIFVGQAEEVREFVEEAFEQIFSKKFPNNIKISVLNEQEFRKLAPSPNTIGLSLNRSRGGLLSEIFILNDMLGRVMLTIGHELGHVLTATLSNSHHEEAKAYAFSLVWMKVIRERNIANLGDAIVLEHPAENGLHNIAFDFVHKLLKDKDIEEIYSELIQEEVSPRFWEV